MKLGPHDRIVAGYAQPANGPGLHNTPFWIIVRDSRTGELREECLQPDEQSPDLRLIYSTAAELHRVLGEVLARDLEESDE